jgi:MoaA/NifB/PqqE/SkfB family radical SAM enzyme
MGAPSGSAVVLLTEVCDKSCPHCFNTLDPAGRGGGDQVDVPLLSDLLAWAQPRGLREVVLTGGEPLLHPGCVDAVRRASALGLRTTLYTSGTRLAAEVDRLHDAGLSGLRLGFNELPYLGSVAALDRVWPTLIERIAPARTHVDWNLSFNLIVSALSIRIVGEVVNRLADLDIRDVKVQPFYVEPGAAAYQTTHLGALGAADWDAHAERLSATGMVGQAAYVKLYGDYFRTGRVPTHCGAAPMLVVGGDGRVHPCLNRFDLVVGRLGDPPQALWEGVSAWVILRDARCFRESCLCLFRPQSPTEPA